MPRLRYALAVLLALFALLTLLERFLLVELLLRRTVIPFVLASLEAVAIVAIGAAARRTKPIDIPLSFAIGYPLFGTLCFLVGTLRIATWTMVPLVVVGAVGGAWAMSQFGIARVTLPPANFGLFAVVIVLACGFVVAQAPPVSLDELAYHLAVPHAWALEGRAVELPLISHSYFPMGIESADLPLFMLLASDGGVASHLLHLFAAIAATLLIARRTESWLATAAIVTTPAIAVAAGWSIVEWPLIAVVVALFVALESGDDRTAAAATAAGMLTKYTFLPIAILLWVMAKKWRPLVSAVAIGSVFFIRNLILTGNPFAPFFATDAPHVSGYRELFLSEYIFEGTFTDEALGASLLAMLVFTQGRMAWSLVAAGVALFFLAPSSRILVPFFAIPVMTAAPALQKRALRVLVILAVVVQTFFVVWFTERGGTFALLAGTTSEEEFLRKQRPSYDEIEWLNGSLPRGSRTLVIGIGETYWFTRAVRGGGNFDSPRVSRFLEAPTPEALRTRLRNERITHVAVISERPPTAVEQKLEERQTRLSPAARRMLAQTLDVYAANVATRGNATLFTLR